MRLRNVLGNLDERVFMISFKDQVLQAREIYLKHREEGEDAWKETATIILGNLHERVFLIRNY